MFSLVIFFALEQFFCFLCVMYHKKVGLPTLEGDINAML